MTRKVLVAYATKKGSTREVAEVLATRLAEHGLAVDVAPADGVDSLGGYDGVLVGGSLYAGHWQREAIALLKRERGTLAEVPLAVFAIGPLTSEPHDLAGARKQLDHALGKLHGLEPRAIAVFGGVVRPEKLRFPFNRMTATDARDWDAIAAFADEAAALFGARQPAASHAG